MVATWMCVSVCWLAEVRSTSDDGAANWQRHHRSSHIAIYCTPFVILSVLVTAANCVCVCVSVCGLVFVICAVPHREDFHVFEVDEFCLGLLLSSSSHRVVH